MHVQVTLLLPSARLSGDSSADARRVMTQVTDYNQRMSGEWRPVSCMMHATHKYTYHCIALPTTVRAQGGDLLGI